MAARVTPDELIRMHQLYNKYHNYARVARELGRSASCVSYNIKMKTAPKVVKDTFPEAVRKWRTVERFQKIAFGFLLPFSIYKLCFEVDFV